jgi:hypothetical protein
MELRKQIKAERDQQRAHLPFQGRLFDRINALVKAYGLDETFVAKLDDAGEPLLGSLTFGQLRTKASFQPPLFSLSTEPQYRVTMAILERVGNSYLHFVQSPDEILLCGPLFRRNPFLGPEQLTRYHFETLLLYGMAKEEVKTLTQAGEQIPRDRLTQLEAFIARVENR